MGMGLEAGLLGVVRRLRRVAAPFMVTRYGNAFVSLRGRLYVKRRLPVTFLNVWSANRTEAGESHGRTQISP
jgi:hypothetical protein